MTDPYQALPAEPARLLRLLAAHPGPEISLGALTAAAGLNDRRGRQGADILVSARLLEQTGPGRYRLPACLRTFAADRAREEDPPEAGRAALRRVLDWYLHTADAAQTWIEPTRDRVPLDSPDAGVRPLAFADYDQAVDWAEREQANFLPAVRAAEEAGLDQYTWRLPPCSGARRRRPRPSRSGWPWGSSACGPCAASATGPRRADC